MVDRNERVLDRYPPVFAELAQSAGDGLACGTGHRCHLFVGQKQRKTESAGFQMVADLVCQFKQKPPRSCRHSFCKGNTAGILKSEAVFLADALHGAHLGFLVAAQEDMEPLTLHRPKLRRRQGLSRDFIEAMRENSVEA